MMIAAGRVFWLTVIMIAGAILPESVIGGQPSPAYKGTEQPDTLSLNELKLFGEEKFVVRYRNVKDGKTLIRKIQGRLERRGDTLVVLNLVTSSPGPRYRENAVLIDHIQSIRLAKGKGAASILDDMTGRKVEIRLVDASRLKGKLLRVYGDSLEVRLAGEMHGARSLKISEIESIKRTGKTNPMIFLAVGLYGWVAFGVIVGICIGS